MNVDDEKTVKQEDKRIAEKYCTMYNQNKLYLNCCTQPWLLDQVLCAEDIQTPVNEL